MALFPLLQFQNNNPMGNALETALKTYQGLGEGQTRKLQNQKMQAEQPYMQQMLQEKLKGQQLGNQSLSLSNQGKEFENKNSSRSFQAELTLKQNQAQLADLQRRIAEENRPHERAKLEYDAKVIAAKSLGLENYLNGGKPDQNQNMGLNPNQENSYNDLNQPLQEQMNQEKNQPKWAKYSPAPVQENNPFSRQNIMNLVGHDLMDPISREGAIAKTKEQNKKEVTWKNDLIDQGAKAAEISSENISSLNRAQEHYNKLWPWERGFYVNEDSKKLSSNAQIVVNSINKMGAELPKKFPGALATKELDFLRSTLPSIAMNPDAFEDTTAYLKAINERIGEYSDFIAANEGASSRDIKKEWARYQRENPIEYEKPGDRKSREHMNANQPAQQDKVSQYQSQIDSLNAQIEAAKAQMNGGMQ